MNTLKNGNVKLKWIGDKPKRHNRIALLIPQFNESSNKNFNDRLEFFKSIAIKYKEHLDVILIDDGSTKNCLSKIIDFQELNTESFFLASVNPNANKVGALFLTAKSIENEFIILSDFDTDIMNFEKIFARLDHFKNDLDLMGCYFRMLPYEGSGNIFLFQQLEYSLARSSYKYHRKDKAVRVMPGAGSIFKRDVLIGIYNNHSGLRNGEDREATLIGQRLGFTTNYMEDVLTLTRPPLSIRTLIKQRVRWNLGYLETFYKEKTHYNIQIKKVTSIGMMTLLDIFTVFFTVLFPFIFFLIAIKSVTLLFIFLILTYVAYIGWILNLLFLCPTESYEFKEKRLSAIILYPCIKIAIDYVSWNKAIMYFIKEKFQKS